MCGTSPPLPNPPVVMDGTPCPKTSANKSTPTLPSPENASPQSQRNPSATPPPTGAKSEAAAAMYDLRFGLNGLRQLWNVKPQSKAESLRGLGSSPTTKPPPSLPPSASAATKAEWYSSMHQQWMTPENPTKPVTACSAIRSQHPAPDSTAGQNAHEYALTPQVHVLGCLPCHVRQRPQDHPAGPEP